MVLTLSCNRGFIYYSSVIQLTSHIKLEKLIYDEAEDESILCFFFLGDPKSSFSDYTVLLISLGNLSFAQTSAIEFTHHFRWTSQFEKGRVGEERSVRQGWKTIFCLFDNMVRWSLSLSISLTFSSHRETSFLSVHHSNFPPTSPSTLGFKLI